MGVVDGDGVTGGEGDLPDTEPGLPATAACLGTGAAATTGAATGAGAGLALFTAATGCPKG